MSELAQWKDVVTGTVALHDLRHVFVEFLVVLGTVHVDEIDDDDASHVPESKLTGKFLGGFHVDCEGVLLLIVESAVAIA